MKKFSKKTSMLLVGIVAALTVVGIAAATVTFDPSTGLGFVGKGDVQTPFGWANKTAQAEASNVSFSYNATNTYDVTIQFSTGNPAQPQSIQHHTVTQNKSTGVNSAVASDPRKTGQWTGWNLTGLGATTTSGDAIPSVGDSCANAETSDDCVVTAVTLTSSTGGLYASDTSLGLGPTLIYTPAP